VVLAGAGPAAEAVPLPALAAVLVVVALNMGEWGTFRQVRVRVCAHTHTRMRVRVCVCVCVCACVCVCVGTQSRVSNPCHDCWAPGQAASAAKRRRGRQPRAGYRPVQRPPPCPPAGGPTQVCMARTRTRARLPLVPSSRAAAGLVAHQRHAAVCGGLLPNRAAGGCACVYGLETTRTRTRPAMHRHMGTHDPSVSTFHPLHKHRTPSGVRTVPLHAACVPFVCVCGTRGGPTVRPSACGTQDVAVAVAFGMAIALALFVQVCVYACTCVRVHVHVCATT
jgi:hypothetical protein